MSDKTQNPPNSVAEKTLTSTKALKVVTLRNKFFYMGYRSSLLILLISLVLFGASIVFAYIFITQPVAPLYIPLTEDGRMIELVRVDQQHKNDQEVADFVAKAVKKVYTRDYISYSDQLMEAASYFTISGINSYLQSAKDSKIIDAIKANQWVMSFTPRAAPILLEKKVANGVFTWAFEYAGTVNYSGAASRQQNVKLTIIVVRTSVVDSPYGMGISAFVPFDDN